ncbi:hypothetical protein Sjap_007542 [Stephania japonica]|uniref:Uncharacterized protein n=1 Tax=Stephania japonica TaxID=461633 RepID=A0AAP0JMV8_9MAGN
MRRNRESLENLDEISDEEGLGGNWQLERRGEEDSIENWQGDPDRCGGDEPQRKQCRDFKGESQGTASTWSTVFKETEELSYMESKSGWKVTSALAVAGNRGKAKPKLSIHHKDRPPVITMKRGEKENSSSIPHLLSELNDLESKITVQSMYEHIEDFHEEIKHPLDQKMLTTVSFSHDDTVQSVAEIMGSLQQRSGLPKEASKMFRRGKRSSCMGKMNASSLDVKIFNEEHSLEAIDSGKSSEDEQTVLQDSEEEHLQLATTVVKGQSVADRFLEAFDAAIEDGGQVIFKTFKHSSGYHERLQQIIRIEKETSLNFLKRLQADNSETDQSRFIDVRILSRCLDAKLTVCECLLVKVTEFHMVGLKSLTHYDHEMLMDREERRIIIFSSKTCGDVGLEIGNAIRVHHPWKEVALVEGGRIIILCSYFSSISDASLVSN